MISRVENNKKQRYMINKEVNQRRFKVVMKVVILIFSFLSVIVFYGVFIGAKYFMVYEYKVTDDLLPTSFHGLKIVHFSDILYDSLNKNDLDNLKAKINDLEPDILVFTGDLKKNDYNLSKDDIKVLENFMGSLKSNIKKYAVSGDNDNEYFKVIMENSNFKVLNNESELVFYKGITPIKVVGFDSNNFKVDDSLSDDNYTICLLHNPDLSDNLKNSNCNLVFAGDSLGGEIKLGNTCLLSDNKYCLNYYDFKSFKLFVSNGVGNNYKIRLFNRPSVNLYRLTKY